MCNESNLDEFTTTELARRDQQGEVNNGLMSPDTRPFRTRKQSRLYGGYHALSLCVMQFFSSAIAQSPDPGSYSSEQFALEEKHGVTVLVRDGIRISVDVYLPKTSDRSPGLLAIGPYGKSGLQSKARWFASRGYVVVIADSRGRYDSEGHFDPFDAKHKTDGYDLVEWMAKQPESNGKIGMWGTSYLGWTQWWTASSVPPHLAAIAPQVAPPDAFENIPYQNGVLSGWVMNWAAQMSGRSPQILEGAGSAGGWASGNDDLSRTLYRRINSYSRTRNMPWFERWYRQNRSCDPYWRGIEYQTRDLYSKMTVPSLSVTGWFDSNHSGSSLNYVGMKAFGKTPSSRRPSLIIGPWRHAINERNLTGGDYGPEAEIDLNGYTVRWFDHFLKGFDNGVERDSPVYVFVMGENQWHAEQDWPLPLTEWTPYYLTSNGHANSLKGDGLLTTHRPRSGGFDAYDYDPRVPTKDAFGGKPSSGPVDTTLSALGDDVLVFQTPPLESPIEVTGPIEATIYAATSARDTDWFVRLVEVEPDGRSLFLADGALRARNRDPKNEGRFNGTQLSTIQPGQIYRYTIRFWRGTGNLFRKGHRIRVEISSSWAPYFLPNPNTEASNLAGVSLSEAVTAHQTLHHGGDYPSHIVLPVIPRRSKAP